MLACLGDGNYGARDDEIENVVCHPQTRVDILGRIHDWVSAGKSSERLLWLKGIAGRGKSAIASTVAYKWKKQKASCALFHFRRGQTALSTRLVCVLARQLICVGTTEVRETILQAIRSNRDVATLPMGDQFRILLVEALQKLEPDSSPVLLVVDALDECENLEYALRFLKAVIRHASSIPANIKFLVTSRPEDRLVRAFQRPEWRVEDLDEAPDATNDIALFLQTSLSEIRMEYHLAKDWPSREAVDSLTRTSQDLFQWAHTVIKYIGERMPEHRLSEVIDAPNDWDGLDDLYHQILTKAFSGLKVAIEEDQLLGRVLGIIVVSPYPVSLETIAYLCADHNVLAKYTQDKGIEVLRGQILADLASMLSIPTSSSAPIQFTHASIQDLLSDAKRCDQKPYFIDVLRHHHNIASRCFHLMEQYLKKNICDLNDLSKPNSDPQVQEQVKKHVPKGLEYCCQSWSRHLIDGWLVDRSTNNLIVSLKQFSRTKLLCWLEVMSLIQRAREGGVIAMEVNTWLQVR